MPARARRRSHGPARKIKSCCRLAALLDVTLTAGGPARRARRRHGRRAGGAAAVLGQRPLPYPPPRPASTAATATPAPPGPAAASSAGGRRQLTGPVPWERPSRQTHRRPGRLCRPRMRPLHWGGRRASRGRFGGPLALATRPFAVRGRASSAFRGEARRLFLPFRSAPTKSTSPLRGTRPALRKGTGNYLTSGRRHEHFVRRRRPAGRGGAGPAAAPRRRRRARLPALVGRPPQPEHATKGGSQRRLRRRRPLPHRRQEDRGRAATSRSAGSPPSRPGSANTGAA